MKLTIKRFQILLFIIFLSACQPLASKSFTSTPSEVTTPASITPTFVIAAQIPTSTSTRTSVPSDTPIPTETPTPLLPQAFNPAIISTFTPAPPSLCPQENPNVELDVKYIEERSGPGDRNQQIIETFLAYLNSGGTLKSILPAYEKYNRGSIVQFFKIQDVTGDTVPELIFPYGIWFDVFSCKDGKFELAFTDTYESNLAGVDVIDISDINQDGLEEITVYYNGCMGSRCPIIRVYEWNGKEFQDLIANANSPDGCSNLLVAPFDIKIRDIDNNGTKEIILSNNRNIWPDNDFPYRKETRTCMWNGQNFVVYKSEFDAPYYRFQAVQDGDRATLSGDYDKALGFYQQTINDKRLQWFTPDRKWHDFWIYHSKYFPSANEPIPTVSPDMIEDPNEYPILASYAYYRIMLVDVLQNDMAKAESTLTTLQAKFPTESPGNYFTQAASIFWKEYQLSIDVKSSCNKVIEYAQENEVPAEYLGDWDHGVHSLQYTAQSICPFR